MQLRNSDNFELYLRQKDTWIYNVSNFTANLILHMMSVSFIVIWVYLLTAVLMIINKVL